MAEERDESYSHVLKYTGIFGGVQGLNILVSLVRNKFVALILGPDGMGLASLFNTTVSFVSQSTNLGISISSVRYISTLYEEDDAGRLAHYIKVVRFWSALTALIGMLACVFIGPLLSHVTFAWGDHSLHFILLAPAVGLLAVTGGETAILKATRRLRPLVVVQVYSMLAALLVSVPVYYFFGQAGIVPVIVLMAFISMLLTVVYSFRYYPLRLDRLRNLRALFRDGFSMVRLGISFVLAGVIGSAAEMLIRSFLNVTGDLDMVGLYNAGYMITVTYAGMVFSSLESDYFPRLSAVNDDREATNLTVNRQMEVTLLLIAPMLTALIIALPLLIPLLFSQSFMPVVAMTQVATLAMFFKAFTLPVAYITLARGLSVTYLMLESAYFVVFVLLVVMGYQQWGLWGTGLAITLANLFDLLMIHTVARCRYGYKVSPTVLRYGAVQMLIGLLAFFTTITVDGYVYWTFGSGLTILSLLYSWQVLRQKTHLWESLTKRIRRQG